MINNIITKSLVLIILTVAYCEAVKISPRRDSFDVIKSVGFSQSEQLLAIYEAEQARLLHGTDLKSIAIHMRGRCEAHFGMDFHCIADTKKPNITFWYLQKYIYLKSDTADNLQTLCIKVVRGSTALVTDF